MRLFVMFLTILAVRPAMGAEGINELARRLSSLRGEVESLTTDLEAKKDAYRTELRSFAEQNAELELQLRREEMRLKQLLSSQVRRRDQVGDDDALQDRLKPLLLRTIEELETSVKQGLPFLVQERLADLAKLKKQLEGALISVQDATQRLWQTIEDELRLARENGLYRQTITLDGSDMLADVARLGMVALFFRTHDGRHGYAVKREGGWGFSSVSSRTHRKQIGTLFDAFKKQVRVGFFELPNTVIEGDPS